MSYFRTDFVTEAHRAEIRTILMELDSVPPASAERIVEAWAVFWTSSLFKDLRDAPASVTLAYSLVSHTRDVVRMGRALGSTYRSISELAFDDVILDEILFVHDIDKLLLFEPCGDHVGPSALSREMPHGVIAGLLLHQMGFDDRVVSVVTTHSTDAPFHVRSPEAMILYYADMASIDHVRLSAGQVPFYQISKV